MHPALTLHAPRTVRRASWSRALGIAAVVLVFAAMLLVVRAEADPIRTALAGHQAAGKAVFFISSVLATLLPALSNLALVPVAVTAWGPGWTALLLLAGWVAGSALSFTIARRCRAPMLARFPALARHAEIDRLLHPDHPLASLVLLRMSFPVDVLSYALGLFSARTSAAGNAMSTAIGAAPFALLFAAVPALPDAGQAALFMACAAGFGLYMLWVSRAAPAAGSKRSATPLLQ